MGTFSHSIGSLIVPSNTGVLPAGITTISGNNTKTGWTEITSSVPINANRIGVHIMTDESVNVLMDYLIDIGIGAAGSESPIISNLSIYNSFGSTSSSFYGCSLSCEIPISIAAGQRLSFRAQCSSGSNAGDIYCSLTFGNDYQQTSYSHVETLGANTTTSRGTPVTANNLWTQISASTTNPIQEVMIALGSNGGSSLTAGNNSMSVGVGAASSEEAILSGINFYTHATIDRNYPLFFGPIPARIPAGSRVSLKINGPGSTYSAAIYGLV